jgi:uncharacterized protein YbaR (Trm112 family)
MPVADLLRLLACPRCKGPLEDVDDGHVLRCRACALRYPVRDGLPILLVEEASPERG